MENSKARTVRISKSQARTVRMAKKAVIHAATGLLPNS
jgi:hypothetical protein